MYIIEDVRFFVPFRAKCNAFRNHERNSTGSPAVKRMMFTINRELLAYRKQSLNDLVTLTGNLELLLAAKNNSLQHFVRRNVCFKISWVP